MKSAMYTAAFYVLGYLLGHSSAANVVSFGLKRTLPDIAAIARRTTYAEILNNSIFDGAYYASVEVGTPSQFIDLQLGTGSSDVWVLDSSAPLCLTGDCRTPFNANVSQTISVVNPNGFNINYEDGTYALGDYINDTFAIGQGNSARMVLQMGLATNVSSAFAARGGIMGIGYDDNEAVAKSEMYPNFMDEMVSNGIINAKVYSLWLNDFYSPAGGILFGGIDTEKFYGTLYSMEVQEDQNGDYSDFLVGLTSISLSPDANSTIAVTNSSFSTSISISASATSIWLPDAIADIIYKTLDAWVDVSTNPPTAYVDCKYSVAESFFSFGFVSGSVVNVAYDEIINSYYVPSTLPSGIPFTDVCYLGIYRGDTEGTVLGDFFLRSAYVVYDLQNNLVGIAQAVFNSTTSNIIEIPSGAASIPRVTGVPLPSATPSPSPQPSPTNPTPSPSPATPTPSSKSAPNHTVPIAIGVAVPVVVILAAIFGFCLYRRRKEAQPAQVSELYQSPPGQQDAKDDVQVHNSQYAGAGFGDPSRLSHMSELPSPVSSPRPTYNGFEGMQAVHEGHPTYAPHNEQSPPYDGSQHVLGPVDMPGR